MPWLIEVADYTSIESIFCRIDFLFSEVTLCISTRVVAVLLNKTIDS